MSGYYKGGTDLDDIFHVVNSGASISEEYKVNNSTTYGRYLPRASTNTYDSANDTGYQINGVDLNRIYALESDIRTRNYLLRSDNGAIGPYNTHGTVGKGADVKFTMKLQKGSKVYLQTIDGGAYQPTKPHHWVGAGGRGGHTVYCSVGELFDGPGSTWNYSNLIAIAGAGGGVGGYSTHDNKDHYQGGAGGNGGTGALSAARDSSSTGIKYWPGLNGGIRSIGTKHPGNQHLTQNYRLPSGGYDFNTTIQTATYAVQNAGGTNSAYNQYYGGAHSGSPEGTQAIGTTDGVMRGTGGGGGAGWQGGQGGVPGTAGHGVEVTALGGGGGSSAIRVSNYPDGVVSVTLNAAVAHDIPYPGWWEGTYTVKMPSSAFTANGLHETIS